jgi:signal-transduction protein with cAMP-binding, CBS, and nucleotidyltransferase domain
MEIEIYKKKRDEIIKRLYKRGESIYFISMKLCIDQNLVRKILDIKIPELGKIEILRVGKDR